MPPQNASTPIHTRGTPMTLAPRRNCWMTVRRGRDDTTTGGGELAIAPSAVDGSAQAPGSEAGDTKDGLAGAGGGGAGWPCLAGWEVDRSCGRNCSIARLAMITAFSSYGVVIRRSPEQRPTSGQPTPDPLSPQPTNHESLPLLYKLTSRMERLRQDLTRSGLRGASPRAIAEPPIANPDWDSKRSGQASAGLR